MTAMAGVLQEEEFFGVDAHSGKQGFFTFIRHSRPTHRRSTSTLRHREREAHHD